MSSKRDADLLHGIRNQLNTISINTELAKLQTQKQQPQDVILASLDKVIAACSECAQQLDQQSGN